MSRQPFGTRPAKSSQPAPAATSTAVRNSPLPKPQSGSSSQPRTITHEMIARRAYEISQSPQRGSDFENWVRAERELKSR
jgi:hypothetical protein